MRPTNGEEDAVRLIMTPLEEFWDVSGKVVFLGEWCRLYERRHLWGPLGEHVIPYPFDNLQRLQEAVLYTERIYNQVSQILSYWLNNIHGIERSKRYWEIIIGWPLWTFIENIYDKYSCIKDAFSLFPNLTTCGLHASYHITPIDFYDNMFHCFENDLYNFQLYTQIAEYLKIRMDYPIVGVLNHNRRVNIAKRKPVLSYSTFYKTLDIISSWIGSFAPLRLYETHFRIRNLIHLIFATRVKVWPISFHDITFKVVDKKNNELRRSLNAIDMEDEFGRLVLYILAQNMPLQYVEGFMNVIKQVKKVGCRPPKAILTTIGWIRNLGFSVWMAESVENGTKAVTIQEGGNGGISEGTALEKITRKISDIHISWGWKESGSDIPLPSAKLMNSKGKNSEPEDDQILWVTTIGPRYTYCFSSLQIGPHHTQYFTNQEKFYQSINASLRTKINLRLDDRWNFGWSLRERWNDKYPELKLSGTQISIKQALQKARLIVIDNLGATTFLEALAMRKPVIIFQGNHAYMMKASAQEHFASLRRVGIFHETPESAAGIINVHYAHIESWWHDKIRQQEVKSFAFRYARTSEKPLKEWVNILNVL